MAPAMLVLAAWMIVQTSRQLRSWSGRTLLSLVIAVLVLASLGAGYETVREVAGATAHPKQGT